MSLSLLSAMLYPPKALASRLLDNARKIFKTPSALAKEIDVTPRTVQRWYTTGKQKYTPDKASLFQLARYSAWKVSAVFTLINDSEDKIIPYLFHLTQQQVSRLRGYQIKGDQQGTQLYLKYLAGFSKNSARYWDVDIKGVQPA